MNKRTVFRISWIAIIVIMIVCTCSITGCMTNLPSGGSGSGQQGNSPTTTARPAPGSVKAIDINLLIPFLPNAPAGWTADMQNGMTKTSQEGSYTWAFQKYSSRDEKRATVSIMDSAYYAVGGWEKWERQFDITTTDGYLKTGTVAGFPSRETYDKNSKSYNTMVGLNNRFMVSVTIDNGEKAELDLFLNSINFQGIAALK